jgi:hypothetical protein
VPFLFGKPYARRSGELGEREREREGGDLSEGGFDDRPRPIEDDAECDLEGLDPPKDWGNRPVSIAMIGAAVIAVNGGYEYDETGGMAMGEDWEDQGECEGYGDSMTCLYSCGYENMPPLPGRVVGIVWDNCCRGGEYMMLGGDWHELAGNKWPMPSSTGAMSASSESVE